MIANVKKARRLSIRTSGTASLRMLAQSIEYTASILALEIWTVL